jgi:hypothetical protein
LQFAKTESVATQLQQEKNNSEDLPRGRENINGYSFK